MKLITLRTFDNYVQAHLIKNTLEIEGMTCFLFDENTVSINPFFNITVGGIKLKVPSEQLDEAELIISKLESLLSTDEKGEIITCPNCNSPDLYRNFKSMKGTKGTITAIISFLLSVFPFYYKTVFKCKNCNTEFNR